MDIRRLEARDIPLIQHANLENLPENYFMKYYLYHALSWPQLSYVAVDVSRPKKTPYDYPKIVGYVLAKMEEEPSDGVQHGHITSRYPSCAPTAAWASPRSSEAKPLHVRVSNKAAIHLYTKTLGFDQEKTEPKYYADGEDAHCMRLDLSSIREQIRDAQLDDDDNNDKASDEPLDEGDPVGDVGKADDKKTAAAPSNRPKETKRKVKVGRALGVQALVEKDESKHS
ncbi:N-terminal acetyltransferase A complex catalytic subunit ard1 [Daldinia childiae]|uniref:N-terminal acetyltransferase A complex catalytic subunit ard1 n=1 Tax=Daldinia childiae TaxID=326645 RepID=UPI0014476267|nr:N-terminal acetyltransferase A complex catalytic subunit ard1 [Daldinia childiae]KAF3058693.1 N-terminal acetyltransferase A complex catalytic subunit ard1 [Daldinia childiae]